MVVNPFMPVGYQYQGLAQQQSQQQTGLVWVLGEENAKSYPVAPNNTIALWDSEKMVIYLKTVDAFGRPSMSILDYTMRKPKDPPTVPAGNTQNAAEAENKAPQGAPTYVTREELTQALKDLEERLKGGRSDVESAVSDDKSK